MTAETTSILTVTKISGYIGSIAFFEWLELPHEQMCILGLLMVIDFITGIGKQYRVNAVEITSHKAWLGVMKKIGTILAILSLALVLKGIDLTETEYIKGALAILIMAEGYSTLQNIYAIRTGKILPEFDVISIILKRLGEAIEKKIEATINIK